MSSTLKVDILQDSGGNNLVTSNGSGVITAAGFGKIGQVVSTTNTSATSIGTVDTITEFINATITPSSTSSKILITCNGVYGNSSNDSFGHILLFKGSSSLSGAIGDTNSSAYRATTGASLRTGGGASSNVTRQFSFQYLDSPATTSATTYSGRAVCTNNTTMYIGRSGTVSDDNRISAITTLTLMEVLP